MMPGLPPEMPGMPPEDGAAVAGLVLLGLSLLLVILAGVFLR